MSDLNRAVVLLSGGIDSYVTLARALELGDTEAYALTIDYEQLHWSEINASRRLAEPMRERGLKDHRVVVAKFRPICHSPLTGDGQLPVRTLEEIRKDEGPSPAYVPARNSIFLSLALGWAETIKANSIWFGCNLDDQAGFVDCRPVFIEAMQKVATVTASKPVRIVAPFLTLRKWQVIHEASRLNLDLQHTVSCYNYRGGEHCGRCDACAVRRDAFERAQVPDPTTYLASVVV